ncbi:MAG: hypothetical protein A3F68_06180 [Acidobacteria bacterium RIFCSPLOWO2_12_FULL_54_10]|nr:MAG: hypothetical protein A3F68_06180 [Acidobacteria bacterium RIFCSPLOWO2_12_FULL_54_10]
MEALHRIVVADDEPEIRSSLADYFNQMGYECRVADNGMKALAMIQEFPAEALLSDVTMEGGMSGLEVMREGLELAPQMAVVLMTGGADVNVAIEALRLGASDFLLKPFQLQAAENSVRMAIQKKQALQETKQELARMKEMIQEMLVEGSEVARIVGRLFNQKGSILNHQSLLQESKVSFIAEILGKKLSLVDQQAEDLRFGALLHDIGKVVVPSRILMKTAPLTQKEREIVQRYVEEGYSILAEIAGLEATARIVREQNERYDGKGYPRGLAGEQICLGARILAVAECYDALTSDRPYRKAQPANVAREEVRRHAGTQFDPSVVNAFLSIPPEQWQG